MHLQSVRLQNFRRFERFECAFDPHFTLLMGANGTGKTSLLHAVWCSSEHLGTTIGVSWPTLEATDVYRTATTDTADEFWRRAHFPCVLEVAIDSIWPDSGLGVLKFGDSLEASGRMSPNSGWGETLRKIVEKGLHDRWFDAAIAHAIPLFARIDASKPGGSDVPSQVSKPFENKRDVLELVNRGGVNVQNLAQWFQYNELRQLQEGKAPLIYEEVRATVLQAIHAEDIRYVVRDNALMVRHTDVGWRPFSQLSDGQLRIASIFCDLAMRCASLNSHLGAGSIAKTPGLVTIDELDLHLHPKWQQQVVGDLRRVFPLLQFIVTSHSPFLLQAAFEHGAVVDMATGQFVEPSDPSIEDIAEGTMGVVLPQRGKRFQTMKAAAQAYYELLEKVPNATPEEKAQIKQQLDEALIPYTNDPAYAAFLEMHRAAAGV